MQFLPERGIHKPVSLDTKAAAELGTAFVGLVRHLDDGVTDGDEVEQGLDPNNPDSDGDGKDDGEELENGQDPLDPSDNGTTTDNPLDPLSGQYRGGCGGCSSSGTPGIAWLLPALIAVSRRRH